MAIFSEWSNAATFEKLEVDAERGVITEEWRAHQDAKWRTSQARRPFLLANTRNLDREPTHFSTPLIASLVSAHQTTCAMPISYFIQMLCRLII